MKQVPGYTLVRTEDCPEQHGTLTVLTHDVSGATILLVENEDNNKAFGIGFGTFPSDDTGVFHILEHSVLAGSEKYPVTSPFLQLLKSSMASFLNAMTFPDKTVYPFATPNETDFRNLMDVYLNAVFCPLAMVDRAVFEQEGWHRDADGTVSGVVYNEMQGALATPNAPLKYMPPTKFMTGNIFRGHIQDALFNMVTILTNQRLCLLGMMTEAIHTPFMSDRALSIENAQYIFRTMKDLGSELTYKENGIIRNRANEVLTKAADLLKEIETLGLFTTIEKGIFADVKRPKDGGKGLAGVVVKDDKYFNPFIEVMKGKVAE